MSEISDRLFRVAALGVVPDDDPHVIADANAEIERLGVIEARAKQFVICQTSGNRVALEKALDAV